MTKMKTYEYIWLDGYEPEPNLRSKIIATVDDIAPEWSFDGSSTKQADTKESDCLLIPVQTYNNPTSSDYIVLCQVLRSDHSIHTSNTRALAADMVTEEWWFGFEQEYYLTHPDGTILGWEHGEPRPEGEYYCGIGPNNVVGRELADAHMVACHEAGIEITGTNAEVGLGQWEFQCFGKGIKAADDLWVSRYLLNKMAEERGICVNYHPKPKPDPWDFHRFVQDVQESGGSLIPLCLLLVSKVNDGASTRSTWAGSGMHANFSNEAMRTQGGKALFESVCKKLGKVHHQAISAYGSDNSMRLTGRNETQEITKFSYGVSDRGSSIRVPVHTLEHDWKGYLEDRRPSSNADPYLIVAHIVGALK